MPTPATPRGEAATDPELLERLRQRLASDYTVESELGGGGMSRVFRAHDHALSRPVVIKVLPRSLAETVSVDRFRREIMFAARLQHPNIVPVLAAGDMGELPYFVMPFIDGESLRPRIQRGPLSVRETVSVLRDVARALAFAHRLGIVHRDIKPDNILLASGAAVVTDFGVAKAIVDSRSPEHLSRGSTITAVGVSLGTPQYMAPEQAAADPTADHRVDIYALGIVGYEMLAGAPPFHGRGPHELLTAQLTEMPPPLTSRRYDIPAALAQLIMQSLEKDPARRPKSAADVLRILESSDAVSGEFAAPPNAAVRSSRARPWMIIASIATVAALGAWLALRAKTPPRFVPLANSITVTTIEAVGGVPSDTTIARAIAVDLAGALANIAGVRVLRAPAFLPIDTSAAGPVMLLDGTVQRSGERLRVNLRIAASKTDSTLWTGRFEGMTKNLLALEDSVAAGVASALRSRLRPR